MKTTETQTVRVAFTKGVLCGQVLECEVDDRGWVTPTEKAIQENGLGTLKPIGYCPIGDRADWSKWGFVAEDCD